MQWGGGNFIKLAKLLLYLTRYSNDDFEYWTIFWKNSSNNVGRLDLGPESNKLRQLYLCRKLFSTDRPVI